ncbi:MAG: hypothetical protein M3O33_16020 [Cyanobacteriota bacterium]|nr:hypothetical protein [Cyanobacteriota bacterium]
MTSKKNLWGELPEPETIHPPYTILKEQGSILSEITNGLLLGEITNNQKDNFFVNILRIKAPSIYNYTYSVVEAQYPIKLYPVFVKNLTSDNFNNLEKNLMNAANNPLMSFVDSGGLLVQQGYSKYSSEEEFENALGQILSSKEVKQVISALLAQIHADIPKQ